MLPFIIVGAVGLVLVLISVFAGELFDLLDGAISATGVGAALAVFGAVGAIVYANGLAGWLTYVIAIGVALVVLLGVQLIIRSFKRSEDGAPASPLGLYGTARSTITHSSGEVSLDGPMEIETRMAFADERIEPGTRIRVVEQQGTRIRVEPVPAAAPPATAPQED